MLVIRVAPHPDDGDGPDRSQAADPDGTVGGRQWSDDPRLDEPVAGLPADGPDPDERT
jgi:hypothetical protein